MKVLFASRKSIFEVKGGDTIQLLNTASELRKLGVVVDIYKGGDVNFEEYDLLHFFNLIRPAEILELVTKTEVPYVVSTIYVDYSFYKKLKSSFLHKLVLSVFEKDGLEYLKALVKHILGKEKQAYWQYFFIGHKKSIKKVLNGAAYLLPNSTSEYNRVVQDYNIKKPFSPIVNGVNLELFVPQGEEKRQENLILCVGQIEPRKNQLKLIEALNNTKYQLLIIGKVAQNHLEYYKKCKEASGSNIEIINDVLPQEALLEYYAKAKVHVLPSWFETTGLSSLEAAAMGCNIVVTKMGDTQDYFKNYADYCDPDNADSIFNAIELSVQRKNSILREYVRDNFTWANAAKETLLAYKKTVE